ncbi:MAG: hypothetical protein JXR07_16030 [Reichenbachiella sp.]
MISYFKANDPYRILGVFLLLVVIRLPILLSDLPMILPELKWLLIGEKLANGALMYRDVWDYASPLSSFVYKWLNVIFGRSAIPLQVFSTILVIFQAGIFNKMMLNNKAYNQNTYVPAFVYMILMNSYFDFMTLSPVLMSMTFNLLAMNNLFKRMDNTTRDELFVFTGIYLGVATLFYLPSVLFFLFTILSLLLYTGSILRRMLLLIYGYVIVLILCSIHYYWYDGALRFHEYFYGSLFELSNNYWLTPGGLLMSSAIPFLLLVLSIVKTWQEGRFVNFQIKIQYVMLFFLLAGVISMFMVKDISTFQLIFFVPSTAFFITHYLLIIKNWILAEGTTALIIVAVVFNFLLTYNGWVFFNQFANHDKLNIVESNYERLVEGKKIVVIGEELSHYKNAKLATPFLNWQQSSKWLENPNYYDNITLIYTKLSEDLPEVIIDEKRVMNEIFEKLPLISNQYELKRLEDDIYLKKN